MEGAAVFVAPSSNALPKSMWAMGLMELSDPVLA
jgi:hypothetical protein